MEEKLVKLAVNGGISFGAKLSPKQLLVIASHMKESDELELTTFQQLYIDIPESKVDEVVTEFEQVGLSVYPVGSYVKSLRTCNFCKGAEEEGMPVAIELNNRIAGKPVPFTLRPAYTGCPTACGEPLVNDIGVIKMKDHYDLYVGGKAKGKDAMTGIIFAEKLEADQLYVMVEKLIDVYAQNGRKREPFAKFVHRYGMEHLKQEVTI